MVDNCEENFLRIVLLLMKYGGMVLQHRIECELYHQWQTVSEFLSKEKHAILHLTFGKSTKCCQKNCNVSTNTSRLLHRDFLNAMFIDVEKSCTPRSRHHCSCHFAPKAELDISSWDITLTSSLLLELIIKEPSQRQVILNLRNHRNSKELLHRGKPGMDEEEFSKFWICLSRAIMEVAEKCEPWYSYRIQKEIDEMKHKHLTNELGNLGNCWRQLKKAEDHYHYEDEMCKMSSLISEMITKLPKDSTSSAEMENIACYTEYSLQDHRNKMYIHPKKAMRHSLKYLEDYKTITVVGDAGSGKTRFCLELMTKFHGKHQDLTPLILTESSQWYKIRFDKKYIIFIDDFVGKSNLDDVAFESWSRVLDLMTTKLNKVYIIFALRHCIWQTKKNALTEFTMFKVQTEHKHPTVDLSGSKFGMTSTEKLMMLEKCCECNGVAICKTYIEERKHGLSQTLCIRFETLKNIASMELRKGFPYLSELFFSREKSLQMGLKFFQLYSANEYEKQLVDGVLCQEKYLHYAILIFLFLNEKAFTREEIIKSKTKIAEIAKMIGDVNPKRVNKATLQCCFQDMQSTFISISDNVIKLRHMVTYEAVLMSFGENFPDEFLACVNKTVLFTYVRSCGYVADEHEVILLLGDEMTSALAEKLLNVYESNVEMAYTDVYKHPSFLDRELVVTFLGIVEKDERFKAFLDSFVAGACMEKKDILASETIRRFSALYVFDPKTFNIVVHHDMIYTCSQYIIDPKFRKFLLNVIESKGFCNIWDFFLRACQNGARQCVKALIDTCHNGKGLEENGDCTKPARPNHNCLIAAVDDILIQHSPAHGHDWSEVLDAIDERVYLTDKEKQGFYREILMQSLFACKLDITLKYLKKIHCLDSCLLKMAMTCIFTKESLYEIFYALCSKMQREQFQLENKIAAEMCIFCVLRTKNENMFLTLMNQNQCDFSFSDDCGNTVLHACEQRNFSNATLLRLLKRHEGQSMFTSQNARGKTPVQCRESYKRGGRVRIGDASVNLGDKRVRDDTFIKYSYPTCSAKIGKHPISKQNGLQKYAPDPNIPCLDIQSFILVHKRSHFKEMRHKSENLDYDSVTSKLEIPVLFPKIRKKNVSCLYWKDDSFIDYESFKR